MSPAAGIAGFLVFACAAAVAAYTVGHIAHDDLGFARQAIRTQALLFAAVLGGLLVITLFGSRFGKRK
jgi:ABC-type branched-subunit amino acid transport system permease subunit